MAQPSLNTWAIIFLVAAVQGFFLAFMLALKKSRSQSILAVVLFLFSTCLLYYVAFWTGYLSFLPRMAGICLGFNYVIGPLIYFYTRSGYDEASFSRTHLFPFLIFILYFLFQNHLVESRVRSLDILQVVLQIIHLGIYAFLSYRYVEPKASLGYAWRKQLVLSFMGYVLSVVSYYLLAWSGWLRIEYDYMISASSCLFIYFVGYKGYVHPEQLRQLDHQRYARSSLSKRASGAILTALKNYFSREKPYLKSDLKLADVADRTSFSAHHISQSLNQVEGVSFPDFVNRYRFEEAKRILSNSQDAHLRIIDVAYDSGFNNKTTFTNVFKRFEGITPSEYREKMRF